MGLFPFSGQFPACFQSSFAFLIVYSSSAQVVHTSKYAQHCSQQLLLKASEYRCTSAFVKKLLEESQRHFGASVVVGQSLVQS
jgi:hypothetical protein